MRSKSLDTTIILLIMTWMALDGYRIFNWGYHISGILFGLFFVVVGGLIIWDLWRD
jgi:hypothetical protein